MSLLTCKLCLQLQQGFDKTHNCGLDGGFGLGDVSTLSEFIRNFRQFCNFRNFRRRSSQRTWNLSPFRFGLNQPPPPCCQNTAMSWGAAVWVGDGT